MSQHAQHAQVVRIHAPGGPEVMQLEQLSIPDPAANEVQVQHSAIGLNFIDTYHRSGLYPVPLPSGLGLEAAGTVTATGSHVTHLKPGDRIAYGAGPIGAYASLRNIPASRVSKLPERISDETAAAMMLKGMTVRYLQKQTYPVK
ncbi:MAG TPA: alcohol dehydrogenase catalytic domain-containing protein, partial [Thiolinea sp.]|nr:alcohol dehydrogenase catalytic domain-containing protein [Thiolinea sp.]